MILNRSYKKSNHILRTPIIFYIKLMPFLFLPEDIFCKIDVAGLYSNITHENWLVDTRKVLDAREDKTVSTDSLIELAKCILKGDWHWN